MMMIPCCCAYKNSIQLGIPLNDMEAPKILNVQLDWNVVFSQNHKCWQNLLIFSPSEIHLPAPLAPLPSVHRVKANGFILTCMSRFQNCFRTFCPPCHADILCSQLLSNFSSESSTQPPTSTPLPQHHHQRPLMESQLPWNEIGDWNGGNPVMQRRVGGKRGWGVMGGD